MQKIKMMKKFLIHLLLFSALIAAAQDDYYTFDQDVIELSPFTVTTGGSYHPRPFDPRNRGGSSSNSPIRIIKNADIATLTLTVSSDYKAPDERITALQTAFFLLKQEAAQRKDIILKSGYIELPLETGRHGIFSSSRTSNEVSSFDVTLIAKMREGDTLFQRASMLNAFVSGIEFPKHLEVLYVSSGIALLDLENFRTEILQRVAALMESTRSILGGNTDIEITGLDKPIQVYQLDEIHLELTLPVQMSLNCRQ